MPLQRFEALAVFQADDEFGCDGFFRPGDALDLVGLNIERSDRDEFDRGIYLTYEFREFGRGQRVVRNIGGYDACSQGDG